MTLSTDWSILANSLLIVCFILTLMWGYKKGILAIAMGLISTIAAFFVALLFAEPFAKVFPLMRVSSEASHDVTSIQNLLSLRFNTMIWLIIIFIAFKLLFVIIKPIISMITKIPVVKQINSLSGMIVSVVVFYLWILLFCFLLSFPVFTNGSEFIRTTWLGPIQNTSTQVFSFMKTPFEENELIQKALSGETMSYDQLNILSQILKDNGISNEDIIAFLSRLS